MFADDTNIYGKVDDGINDTIENVSVWMESNKLAINRYKFKAISLVLLMRHLKKKFMITISNLSTH